MSACKLKPPFKGRPALELLNYVESLVCGTSGSLSCVAFNDLMIFLLDIDVDCSLDVEIETPSENPTGLAPSAMVQKMDLLLNRVLCALREGCSEESYIGYLDVFEETVLRVHQPHFIQFVTFYQASSSKQRADSFLSLLLNIVHDQSGDPIARREAVSYLGSFVCRAKLLSWTHSARTAKYLVSFMHSLNMRGSSSDRMLGVLCLQTLCYMICWECEAWKNFVGDSCEMDWVCRSKKGLVAFLLKYRSEGMLRLVSLDILTKLFTYVGRISTQLKELVSEAIAQYKQVLAPAWKSLVDSSLLKPHFPFDPQFRNLARSAPLILPLCRDWTEPGEGKDFVDGSIFFRAAKKVDNLTTDESSVERMEDEEDVWSYRPLASPSMGPVSHEGFMSSPLLEMRAVVVEKDPNSENPVLSRILSSRSFASAPTSS